MVDEYVMSFSPNKRQFDFLKDVILKKEYEFKLRYKKGLKKLLKAKDIIWKTSVGLRAFINFMMETKVLKDKQIMKSKITGINYYHIKLLNSLHHYFLWLFTHEYLTNNVFRKHAQKGGSFQEYLGCANRANTCKDWFNSWPYTWKTC